MPEKTSYKLINRFATMVGVQTPERKIHNYREDANDINRLEAEYEALSDEQLRAKTDEFKTRLGEGADLEDLLPEAFAAVREASKRTIGLRHHDVQLMGGAALFDANVAEMRTGEGKTLVATLPLYLKALEGKGAHLVTVNDHLARRDARWMAPIFNMLGMSVGVLQSGATTDNAKYAYIVDFDHKAPDEEHRYLRTVGRALAYEADVTYGTNSEFGFDYLRDNMVTRPEDRVQRGHHFAIIDEVDNVLIDEARMPLIISGPNESGLEAYPRMAQVVRQLAPHDYQIDEKERTVSLTSAGTAHVESLLGQRIADETNPEQITVAQAVMAGYLEQALRAQFLYRRGKEYLVQGGKVVIVDEFTGRLLPARRWQDGLHQAVEAKEQLKILPENVTYAMVTLQNYFRMYQKLAGMTGTGLTEAQEFKEIYNLEVVPIPPNNPEIKRIDEPDEILRTEDAKLRKIVQEIVYMHVRGRPVLVGTTSVEDSDRLSQLLDARHIRTILQSALVRHQYFGMHGQNDNGRIVKELEAINSPIEDLVAKPDILRELCKRYGLNADLRSPENLQSLAEILNLGKTDLERLLNVLESGIPHQVLNARNHALEAQIIAGAGAFGAVTIATNMAGRGIDIKLGGEIPEEVLGSINRILRLNGIENPYQLTNAERLDALQSVSRAWRVNFKNDIETFERYVSESEIVKELGGLRVIGSERHEARRIDNQLRGRAARQDDPGSTKFYLSLQDDLPKRFGGEAVSQIMVRLKADDSFPVKSRYASRSIEKAQMRIEGANFDIRKHLLEYDNVINAQRRVLYAERDKIMDKPALTTEVIRILTNEVEGRVTEAYQNGDLSQVTTWLEVVQPGYEINGTLFPSFNDRVMLETLNSMQGDTRQSLYTLAVRSLRANPEKLSDNILADIFRDVDRELQKAGQPPSDQDKLRLLRRMAYGVRTVTHPETRQRGLQIYKRLDFSYAVAEELEKRMSDSTGALSGEILKHLSEARSVQVQAWGNLAIQSPDRPQIPGVADTVDARGSYTVSEIYRQTLINTATFLWQEYLTRVEALRTSVSLEAYAKNDPLVIYKAEAADTFRELLADIRSLTVLSIYSKVPAEPDWETFARSIFSAS